MRWAWLAAVWACRLPVSPPVVETGDPDAPLPDTEVGLETGAETDPVDTDGVDTDVVDTDGGLATGLGGHTAVLPLAMACQAGSRRVFSVEMLDWVEVDTDVGGDLSLPQRRVRSRGSVPGTVIMARWHWPVGFHTLTEIRLEELFARGRAAASVDLGSFPNGARGSQVGRWMENINIDTDTFIESISTIGSRDSGLVATSFLDGSYRFGDERPVLIGPCGERLNESWMHEYRSHTKTGLMWVGPITMCRASPTSPLLLPQPRPLLSAVVIEDASVLPRRMRGAESRFYLDALTSAATADMNGDGVDDVILADAGSDPSGRLYIWFSPLLRGNIYADSADAVVVGDPGQGLGMALASLGDLTGDGAADLLVHSVYGGTEGLGAVELLRGPIPAGTHQVASLRASRWSMTDESITQFWDGLYVAGHGEIMDAGDVNGDGVRDFVLSRPYHVVSWHGELEDTTTVVDTGDQDTDRPPFRSYAFGYHAVIPGGAPGDVLVEDVALRVVRSPWAFPVGDVDQDGYDDILFRNMTITRDIHVTPDPTYGLLRGCAW